MDDESFGFQPAFASAFFDFEQHFRQVLAKAEAIPQEAQHVLNQFLTIF